MQSRLQSYWTENAGKTDDISLAYLRSPDPISVQQQLHQLKAEPEAG